MQSYRKVLVLGFSVSALALAAVPEALGRAESGRLAAIDPMVPLTPAVKRDAVVPDPTPAVALRRQASLDSPVRLARVSQVRSDATASEVAGRLDLPVPGAFALFGLGLLGLAVARRRRPRHRAA